VMTAIISTPLSKVVGDPEVKKIYAIVE